MNNHKGLILDVRDFIRTEIHLESAAIAPQTNAFIEEGRVFAERLDAFLEDVPDYKNYERREDFWHDSSCMLATATQEKDDE